MTQFPDLFAALAAPFEREEVRKRTQAGRDLHYITARTAMNRLDSVLGPENWWDEYVPAEHSVLCRLTLRLPDGSTLTKSDAGGYAGMADSGDDDKSGFSDSFKRAAVKFGVGRYLYRDGVPAFVRDRLGRPEPEAPAEQAALPAPREGRPRERGYHSVSPRNGRELLGWATAEGKARDFDLVQAINRWAKPQGYPYRFTEWDSEQVASGLSFAAAVLRERDGKAGAA